MGGFPRRNEPLGDVTPTQREQRTARIVAQCSPVNRPDLERHVELDRTNFEETSLQSWAMAVVHADRILSYPYQTVAPPPGWILDEPKAWTMGLREAGPDECLQVVSAFRRIYGRHSLRLRSISFRKHLRYLYGVDDLEKSECLGRQRGRAMEEALWVKREKEEVVGQVITDAHFRLLQASIKRRTSFRPEFLLDVRDRAMWAVLRASGFRVGEFVSLNVGDVTFEGSVARLALREEAPDLKTGPRTVYIHDGVPELRAWLAMHPARDDRDAPLWIQGRAESILRLNRDGVRKTLALALKWSGLDKLLPALLTPHDFRHTCATEKAELGWNEYQMCSYFGWEIGSRTPGTYVHMKLSRQRDRILADAERTAQAARSAPDKANEAVQALLGLVKQVAAKMGRGDDAAPAPIILA